MVKKEQNEIVSTRSSQLPVDSETFGWLLIGGGVASVLVIITRGRRWLYTLLLPFIMITAGITLLLRQRQSNIEQAETSILDELDALGPVARAQVLKHITEKEIGKYISE
jgi:CBS domain containing-hemolysin-like protein